MGVFVFLPPFSMNSLVKTVTWILGIVLLLVGVIGFFNNPVLGIFDADAIHSSIHVLSGLVGIAAAASGNKMSRMFLIVFGLVYALVAVLGFVNNGSILGIFATNRADDYLHSAIAIVCLAVGFGSKK